MRTGTAPNLLRMTPMVLLRLGLFAGGYAHKATGHKAGVLQPRPFLIEELGHAADGSPFSSMRNQYGSAGLDFGIRAYLVYLLAGESAARHHHGLDLIAVGKGGKSSPRVRPVMSCTPDLCADPGMSEPNRSMESLYAMPGRCL